MTNVIRIVLGILLLVSGRKLFWLSVGIVGFLVGISLGARFFADQTQWIRLLIALFTGAIGAALAVFLQRLAVSAAGFIAGGYILNLMLQMVGLRFNIPTWVVYLIGGVIGLILVAALFDWALIGLSSFGGAFLFVQTLGVSSWLRVFMLVVLILIGVGIQAGFLNRDRRHPKTKTIYETR
jgi:hypothetical protein